MGAGRARSRDSRPTWRGTWRCASRRGSPSSRRSRTSQPRWRRCLRRQVRSGTWGRSQIIHAQTFADAVVGDVQRPAAADAGRRRAADADRGRRQRRESSDRLRPGAPARALATRGDRCVSSHSSLRLLAAEAIGAARGRRRDRCDRRRPLRHSRRSSSSRPAELPRAAGIGIDGRALVAFTAGIAMLAARPVRRCRHCRRRASSCADALRGPDGGAPHPAAAATGCAHALVVGQIADRHGRPVDGRAATEEPGSHAAAGRRVCRARTSFSPKWRSRPSATADPVDRSTRHDAARGTHGHAAGNQPCHRGDHGAVRRHAGR